MKPNLWSSVSVCQSGPPAVSQNLSVPHGWPVKKVMIDLLVRLKGNSKHTSSNLSSLLGA